MKRVAILQSSYIPWKGYFDIMRLCDEFILYDDVQFSKGDWRNRNRIKTKEGVLWLTIPVRTSGRFGQPINHVEVAGCGWADKHWESIRHAYQNAPHFETVAPALKPLYEEASQERFLSRINELFLRGINEMLNIETPLVRAEKYAASGEKNERLVEICRGAGATEYLSGPAAQSYLDTSLFASQGIDVVWMDYSGYSDYEQLHGGAFVHEVSIVDTLMSLGSRKTFLHLTGGPERRLRGEPSSC